MTDTAAGRVGMALGEPSGNWQLNHYLAGQPAPTNIDLGTDFPVDTSSLYELYIYSPVGGGDLRVTIRNVGTGVIFNTTLSSNIPSSTTYLCPTAFLWRTTATVPSTIDLQLTKLWWSSN